MTMGSLEELADDPRFSELPHIRECLIMLHYAWEDFRKESDRAQTLNRDDGLAAIINALIEFAIEQATAVNIGRGVDTISARRRARRLVKRTLIARWPTREICNAEYRAMAVSAAYRDGIRFSLSGEKDSRMEAALQAAAIIAGVTGKDASEAIRKSNARLRKKVSGESFLWLNRVLLRVEVVSASDVIFNGFPKGRGRPVARR